MAPPTTEEIEEIFRKMNKALEMDPLLLFKQSIEITAVRLENILAQVSNLPYIGRPDPTDPRNMMSISDLCDANLPIESWSVSFNQLSGSLFSITICIQNEGCSNDGWPVFGKYSMCHVKPSADFLTRVLCYAMLDPTQPDRTGPPHRPTKLFFAYRLQDVYELVQESMMMVGIFCELETKQAAKKSAKDHGTDYKGRNHRTCEVCPKFEHLSFCSACKKASYCSKKCQKIDWKNHKQICRHS